MAVPTYTFFSGLTHTDFAGYECGPGHANDTSGALNNWPYGNLLDAGRGTGGIGTRTGGPRVYIDNAVPTALGFPNNRAVHMWIRQGDGPFAIAGLAGSGMDTSQCEWDESRHTTYQSGPYLGQSRTHIMGSPPAGDGPINGATGWGTNTEVYYGYSMAFPSPMYTNPHGCLVGFEDHDASGGVQPWWSFDVWNGKWSFVIRGGDATFFRNHYFLFDDTTDDGSGFYRPLIGPAGGGSGTWYDMRDGTTQGTASSPAGELFQSRGSISADTRYDIVIRIVLSDREWNGGSPPFSIPPYTAQSWTPMASTAGQCQVWMKKQSESEYRVVVPTTTLATAYSTPQGGGRKALGSYKKLIMYRQNSNSSDFHAFYGEHRRGASFAAVEPTQSIEDPGGGFEDPAPPAHYVGYATSGAVSGVSFNGWISGGVFTASESLDITTAKVRIGPVQGGSGATVGLKAVVHAAPGGNPSTLLAVSNEQTVLDTAADQWMTFTFPQTFTVTSGEEYLIAVHVGLASGVAIFWEATGGEFYYDDDAYNNGPSDPWGGGAQGGSDFRKASMLIAGDPAAGPPAPPGPRAGATGTRTAGGVGRIAGGTGRRAGEGGGL